MSPLLHLAGCNKIVRAKSTRRLKNFLGNLCHGETSPAVLSETILYERRIVIFG